MLIMIKKYIIPDWVFSRTYAVNTAESKSIITNTRWATHYVLEDISSDLWNVLPKRVPFSLEELNETFRSMNIDTNDLEVLQTLESFLKELQANGILQFLGENNPLPPPICQDEKYYLEHGNVPFVAATFNKYLVKLGFLPCALIELTYSCNENCVHCFNPKNGSKSDDLSTDEVIHLINDLYEAGINNIFFSGGEASLRKDLFEILEETKKLQIPFTMFSNGQMSEKDVEKLISFHPQMISVSIYSANPDIHDATTRKPGSFYKSIKTLKMLTDAGIYTSIKCPIMEHTVYGYKEIYKLAKILNSIPQFDIQIRPTFDGNTETSLHQISDKNILTQLCLDPQLLIYVNPSVPHNGGYVRSVTDGYVCASGRNLLSINPNGDIFPCNCLPMKLGNIRKDNIIEIWRNSELLHAWQSVNLNFFNECGMYDECAYCRICPAESVLETGDWFGKPKSFCTIARVRKETADRLAKGENLSMDENFGHDLTFRAPNSSGTNCKKSVTLIQNDFLTRFRQIKENGNSFREKITPEPFSPVAYNISNEEYQSDDIFFNYGRR